MPELKTITFIAIFVVAVILLLTAVIVAIARCANNAMDVDPLDDNQEMKEE